MLTSSNSPWWLIICHTERLLTVKLYKSYLPSFCFLTNLFYWQCSAKLQPLFSCCRKSTHWLEFSIVTSNFLLDAAFSSIMAKINKYHYILLSTLLFSFTLSPYFFWETCIFLIFGCVILWICYFICLWFLRIVGGRVKGSGELNRYAFLDLANTILSWISWSRRENSSSSEQFYHNNDYSICLEALSCVVFFCIQLVFDRSIPGALQMNEWMNTFICYICEIKQHTNLLS